LEEEGDRQVVRIRLKRLHVVLSKQRLTGELGKKGMAPSTQKGEVTMF
jgi:hypothetical protein